MKLGMKISMYFVTKHYVHFKLLVIFLHEIVTVIVSIMQVKKIIIFALKILRKMSNRTIKKPFTQVPCK